MKSPILLKPSSTYKESYVQALQEFLEDSPFPEHIEFEIKNIDNSINHMQDAAQGKNLVQREVARSEFWLIDGEKYIGKIQIRHKPSGRVPEAASHIYYEIRPSERGKKYGFNILKLGIAEANKLGIHELIVTCSKGNLASKKIIEQNVGKFLEEILLPNDAIPLLKYEILT